jgi:hypothetical protein
MNQMAGAIAHRFCLIATESIREAHIQQNMIPKNPFKAHRRHGYGSFWKPAEEREIEGMIKRSTYDLVEPPPGAEILEGRWVYEIKQAADGTGFAKARFKARGDQQSNSSFQDLYASVAHAVSVRTLFTIAAVDDLETVQL